MTWPSWNDRIWLERRAVRNRSNRRIFEQVRVKREIGHVSGLWYAFCVRLDFFRECLDCYVFWIHSFSPSKLVLALACLVTRSSRYVPPTVFTGALCHGNVFFLLEWCFLLVVGAGVLRILLSTSNLNKWRLHLPTFFSLTDVTSKWKAV